jgi:trimeric autotransporter adhesin
MLRRLLVCFSLLLALVTAIPAFAANPPQSRAATRITEPVNDNTRVVLRGNVNPLAQARYDRGVVPPAMAASRLMLLLKHSPTQTAAVREYIDSLQDKNSPNYHKWLTPEQFGANYGPSDQDIQTVTSWLQSHGFTVDRVAKARNVIEFSGTAGQVQTAFNTSIHKYLVNGEQHFANATNPEIPAALAPVVAGVTQLHNFNPKRNSIVGAPGRWNPGKKRLSSDLTLGTSEGDALFVVPADAAVIYGTPNANLNPAYLGPTYDGTGVTVGIAGDSNFTMQDVINYRAFLLNDTSSAHLPNVIVDGNDPGVNGDAGEALLDNEIVGGIAPGAKINFYTSQDTDVQSGLFLSIFRALDDNAVDILNVSFGGCEQGQGQAGNEEEFFAWEQAATQGISVTVSTGDSGSAGCDNPDLQATAFDGLAINGLGSTPYNVAVGGTDFGILSSNYPASFNQYMNQSGGVAPYYGSVTGYIPETVWNQSTQNNTTLDLDVPSYNGQNIAAGGGGISSCSNEDANGDCLGGYAKPAYQTDLTPSDGVRDIPDISLFASDFGSYAAWAVCGDNVAFGQATPATDCQLVNGKPTSDTTVSGIGGTSAAAPTFAGILAMISQSVGGRLGNPNPVLYALAEKKSFLFNDITVGNNSVSCDSGSPACAANGFLTGYDSVTGYDVASGLGSVNASGLLDYWPTITFTPSSTALQLGESSSSLGTGAITATHGTPIDFSIAVNPGASVTGSVSLITDSNVSVMPNSGAPSGFYPVNTDPTAGGIVTGGTNSLPGGTYNLYAYYGGDTNYAASKSNPVPVTISPENSATTLTLSFYDASTGYSLGATTVAPYGSCLFATATAGSQNQPDGIATGTITLKNGNSVLGTPVNLNSAGTASWSCLNQNALPVTSYQMVASYSGDASFNPSVSTPSSFTITKAQISTSLSSASAGVNYGGSVTLTASIATDSIGAFPTGSVTFMSGTTVIGTAPIVTGYSQQDGTDAGTATASIAGTQFPKNGVNAITAVYAGDTNYSASTSNGVGITVTGVPSPKIGLSGPASLTVADPGASTSATITVTPFGGFTGAVNLTCAVTGPAGAISSPTCSSASATITGTTAATATLNIDSTSTTTGGSYSLAVTGVDAATGKLTASTTIPLTVNSAAVPSFALAATPATIASPGASATSTISVTPSGGFTGAVNLTCSASTAGLTCDPATASSGSATLNIHSASTTAPGSYTLTVNGVDAATGKLTASTIVPVTVSAAPVVPSLTISATPVTIASPGASSASTITLTPSGGFTGAVALTCAVTASPSGATSAPACAPATATISGTAPATATLNLQTTSDTTSGSYTIAVTATSGGSTVATANVAVTVSGPTVAAGFTVTGTQVSIASLGTGGSSTITITPAGGFTGQVNLKCAMTSAPSGANDDPTCSFGTSNSVVVGGSTPVTATMNVTTSTTAAALKHDKWFSTAGGAALAGLLFFCVPARRRNRFAMLALLLVAGGAFGIGCGGGGSTPPPTSTVNGTGAFTFTVTGTDAATGALVSTATITVNVQ